MKVIRATKPAAVGYIEDNLAGDYNLSKEDLTACLRAALGDHPDDVFLLLAVEGDEVKAFLVALSESDTDWVALIQAWSEVPKKTLKSMFLRLCLWAEARGKEFVRAHTTRDMAGFLQDFGFQELARVMSFRVTEDDHEEIVDDMIKRNKGGDDSLPGKESKGKDDGKNTTG